MTTFERHPTAKITPDLSEEEFNGLKESIRTHGQMDPGYLYEGKILDGWHRYLACKEVGAEFKHNEFTNTVISATEFVVSKLEGRNLTKSQKACIAVSAKEKRMAEIKLIRENRNQYLGASGKPTRNASKDVAPMFGINWQTIDDAARLKRRSLELFNQVLSGKIGLKTALKSMGVIYPEKSHPGSKKKEERFDFNAAQSSIPNVFASWDTIKNFDLQLAKNWDLVIERFGTSWNARYVPKQSGKSGYSPNLEHAIIAAARGVLLK